MAAQRKAEQEFSLCVDNAELLLSRHVFMHHLSHTPPPDPVYDDLLLIGLDEISEYWKERRCIEACGKLETIVHIKKWAMTSCIQSILHTWINIYITSLWGGCTWRRDLQQCNQYGAKGSKCKRISIYKWSHVRQSALTERWLVRKEKQLMPGCICGPHTIRNLLPERWFIC